MATSLFDQVPAVRFKKYPLKSGYALPPKMKRDDPFAVIPITALILLEGTPEAASHWENS
jgi:hypothetical protein